MICHPVQGKLFCWGKMTGINILACYINWGLYAKWRKVLIILLFCPAFAELQTDMTDLTADLESSGIPTLDHKNYIMKVFFPGVSDHPILNDPKVRRYLDEGIVV